MHPASWSLLKGSLFLLALASAVPSFASVSFRTTLSGGYYRDIREESHFPVFMLWDFNHAANNGVETWIDLGLNNHLIDDEWKFFPYQAYISVPLASNPAMAPFRKSRVQLGRQLLTEGFELSTMDGVQLPFYFAPSFGTWLVAGTVSSLDEPDMNFESQIYGGSLLGELLATDWKAGFFHKIWSGRSADLGYGSLSRTWSSIPWQPLTLVKGQWDAADATLDQALAELQAFPSESFMWSVQYATRQPNALEPTDASFIYRLFAISTQETVNTAVAWTLAPEVRLDAGFRHMSLQSPALRSEKLSKERASVDLRFEVHVRLIQRRNRPPTSHVPKDGAK